MMTQNSDLDSRNFGRSIDEHAGIYGRIADTELRHFLMRREEEVYAGGSDMLDGWLGMAGALHKAKERLVKRPSRGERASDSLWGPWVEERFAGFIGIYLADKLAEIGQVGEEELAALRNTYFQKGSGISAIAAYLAAPEPVKEQVQQGEIQPTASDIARAIAAADEARKRAEERERAARQAEATLEEKIGEIRREAQLQGQLAVEQATARLQRDLDEARHQATLRQRDVDEAQAQIKRAQTEWDERVAYAKKEERDRLEADFRKQMGALQEQLKEQEKAARAAQQQAKDLNDRLTHARDSDAVRARWDALADTILSQCDGWLQNLPSVIDAQYFENHERVLIDSVRKRAEQLVARMKELASASLTVVEADREPV